MGALGCEAERKGRCPKKAPICNAVFGTSPKFCCFLLFVLCLLLADHRDSTERALGLSQQGPGWNIALNRHSDAPLKT